MPTPSFGEVFAVYVKRLRTGLGADQRTFAKRIGKSQAYVSEMESATKVPSIETIENILDALGVSIVQWCAAMGQTAKDDLPVTPRLPEPLPDSPLPQRPKPPRLRARATGEVGWREIVHYAYRRWLFFSLDMYSRGRYNHFTQPAQPHYPARYDRRDGRRRQ